MHLIVFAMLLALQLHFCLMVLACNVLQVAHSAMIAQLAKYAALFTFFIIVSVNNIVLKLIC